GGRGAGGGPASPTKGPAGPRPRRESILSKTAASWGPIGGGRGEMGRQGDGETRRWGRGDACVARGGGSEPHRNAMRGRATIERCRGGAERVALAAAILCSNAAQLN